MPLSRHLPLLARLVLAAWLLALGTAIAAPAVKPLSLETICAGGVMKVVVQGQDDPASSPDCPLCSPPGLVACAFFDWAGVMPASQGLAPASPPASRAGLLAAPPPARGPPLPSLA